MAVFKNRRILTGITVLEAMQKQFVQLPAGTPAKAGVRHIIKFKANAVMVTGSDDEPAGVVTKTDIMGAFYAGLPADVPIGDIMTGPPCFCRPQENIEAVVDQMISNGIHQIYVKSDQGDILGQMAYSDIVGLLYRYCRTCIRSGRCKNNIDDKEIPRLLVKDVMTHDAAVCHADTPITEVIEILSGQKLGALLVTDSSGHALGTISKTDLALAYVRGISTDESAGTIIHSPVATCLSGTLLSDAIQQMLLFDVQRLFVKETETGPVTGVLSLSDATRFRSGTCRACGTGRVLDKS